MTTRKRRWAALGFIICLGLLLGAPLAGAQQSSSEALAVIVNAANPVTSLSMSELRQLFLKERGRWPDGRPVLVVNHKAGTTPRVAFDRKVLRMSPDQAASYWIKQRVRGYGHPPRSFRSHRLIIRLVAKQREAISYVPAAWLKGIGGVKVLKIDGKAPTDGGYPLELKAK